MPPLHILSDPPLDGPTNMARDEHLLHSKTLRPAVLRIYRWSPPTISLGYFQRYDQINELPDDVRQLPVVRRQTGGGAILHDQEITYCLVIGDRIPLTHKAPTLLYQLVHNCWRDTLEADYVPTEMAPDSFPMPTPRTGPFFCFQKPGQTDLIIGQDKLLGSAQRRLPDRVMQHGSLLLRRRFAAHPGVDLGVDDPHREQRWCNDFTKRVADALELDPAPTRWTSAALADVAERRRRYASPEWNRKR